MSRKGTKEKELEHRKDDIVGLIPSKLYDALHAYGYYLLAPRDAFPFEVRAVHKRGFEVILEAETEEGLLIEAEKAMSVFNKIEEEARDSVI
jgi:hypothetical protein